MKGKREADNNFNFKSEKLDELRSRVDAAFDEHGDEAWEQIKGIIAHPKRLILTVLAAVLLVGAGFEVINLVAMAMKTGQEYTFLRDFVFTHPSMSEALNDLMGF